MAKKDTKTPLTEVWLLFSSPDAPACDVRAFAHMGDKEIVKAAEEIASVSNMFSEVISKYVEGEIRKQLQDGDTEIRIDSDESEYIIVKTGIDTGTDWNGDDGYKKPDPKDTKEVYVGSTVYVSEGWYGDPECIYSTDWLSDTFTVIVE